MQPDARVQRAMTLIMQNKPAEAAPVVAQVLDETPDHPQALLARALLDRLSGRMDEALATMEALRERLPNNPMIRAELASTQVIAGQGDKALPALQQMVDAAPNHPFAHFWMGQAHLRAFRGSEAVHCFERVRQLNPKDRNVLLPLAAAHLAAGQAKRAEHVAREAVENSPENQEGLGTLAASLEHQNRLGEAGEVFRQILDVAPDHPRALAGLARVLQTEGRKGEAREVLRPGFDATPAHPVVVSTFAGLAESEEDRRACLGVAKRLVADGQLPGQERAGLCFAAARLHDGLGEHADAFGLFTQGNALAPKGYDPRAKASETDAIIKTFTRTRLGTMPRASALSDRPVFIVGMPRSGTSLVEQILAAHPDVYGAGEVQELRRIWREMVGDAGSIEALGRAQRHHLESAATRYLDHVRDIDSGSARVTDKMPHNFEQLGLISLLFPHARVVHCMRSPLDTCVSCFTVQLGPAHAFSNDLASLGHAYGEYRRLMTHWREALDIPVLDVVYEDVVADLASHARRIVEFVGLPWDESCLRYYEAQRSVTTASVDQVRKPIYTSSVGRWERYGEEVEPLRRALLDAGVADPESGAW